MPLISSLPDIFPSNAGVFEDQRKLVIFGAQVLGQAYVDLNVAKEKVFPHILDDFACRFVPPWNSPAHFLSLGETHQVVVDEPTDGQGLASSGWSALQVLSVFAENVLKVAFVL